jgi:hypothetical protein
VARKANLWERVKCSNCDGETFKHKSWKKGAYICKRCRIESADIEGVLFEITEFQPLFYEKTHPGMVSKLKYILSSTKGDGTTKGYWREVKDSISSDEKIASLFLKVASEFKKLQSEQKKSDKRNGAIIAGIVGRTRRLS